jgi:hypothetical protein
MPEGVIYVGRPTIFGNPWTRAWVIETGLIAPGHEAIAAVANFRAWLTWPHEKRCRRNGRGEVGVLVEHEAQRVELLRRLPELRGRDLACFCPLDRPCHADVLLEIANR